MKQEMKLHAAVPAVLLLTLTLAACSSGITPPPAVSNVTLTGPTSLKVNAAAQVTAAAQDESGSPITGKTFTFTSSNPNVLTVDAAGNVTVKRLTADSTPVTITASVDGKTSNQLSVSTYGLALTVGTYNRDPGQANAAVGMAVTVKFRKAAGGGAASTAPVTLTGPANFDPTKYPDTTLNVSPTAPSSVTPLNGSQAPVIGDYTASATVDGEAYTDTTALTSTALLPAFS